MPFRIFVLNAQGLGLNAHGLLRGGRP